MVANHAFYQKIEDVSDIWMGHLNIEEWEFKGANLQKIKCPRDCPGEQGGGWSFELIDSLIFPPTT